MKDFKGFFVELNLHKKKIILCCSYNPHKSDIANHLDIPGKTLDIQMSNYDNFLIAGSSNTEILETAMSNCCDLHGFIQDPTCYKNPNKPTCIDLIITNFPYLFTKTQNLETGLSDFHKLMFTVLKMRFEKPKPKIVVYRDHKNFSDERFC